jgi:hypothetical protein
MGLGYTLFGKPFVTTAAVFAALFGVHQLPEYWPDHAMAAQTIARDDVPGLQRLIDRGLDANDLAQWRSFPRRSLGRATREGVGRDTPGLGAADVPLLAYALGMCKTAAAQRLVTAGADITVVARDGATMLEAAAVCGDASLVSLLLARGGNANATSPDGGTVLWEPSARGWQRRGYAEAVVRALEAAGARQPEPGAAAR